MFDPVDPKQSFPQLEHGILSYWKEEHVFHRSQEQRKNNANFSFYDGPPFATGLPHYGHLIGGTIKDVIPRYRTMRGDHVQRRFGWDCHGLPIENLIEKEHNLKSKKDIENMGIATFNELCRASVQRYAKEWRTSVERMGRWVDMDWDYKTMDPEFMESIWWVFQELWDQKLIYEGHKPMHVCPRCVTPLSNFEVTQGYKDVTDVSATVMFELEGNKSDKGDKGDKGEKTYVLAWTTTPWTLPGNLFLAIGKGIHYVFVKYNGNRYVVAQDLADKVFKDKEYEVEGIAKHEWLHGKKYKPLFPYFAEAYAENAFKIVEGDFVTTEDGTGIVHIAPGFGEDDFRVGEEQGVPLLQHVTMEGTFTSAVTEFAGMDVKPIDDPSKTDRKIVEFLEKEGKLFAKESYRHSYPHCWRCDSPLLNYATSSWFVAVEKIKEKMMANNKKTEWVPAHLRDGRFGKWLEGARDWAISRNRYWGTPLPIWRSAGGDVEIVGSRDDLMAHQKIRFTKLTAIRHAQSEGNLIGLYQGQVPGTDLTKTGEEQAKVAGKWLKDAQVDVIYTSPLARAQQTAEAIAKATGATVVVDERLREVDFKEYEGTTHDWSDLTLIKARRAHKLQTGAPENIYHLAGMETWGEMNMRIGAFLQDILPKHRSEHVIVVTHADPMNAVKHFFTGEDPFKLSNQPCPSNAHPVSYFWDHDRQQGMDLHKHIVDDVIWNGSPTDQSVQLTMVRHGETDWNKEGRLQGGHGDVPLNALGKAQAAQIAMELSKEGFDVIISSNLKRATETAEIIAKELGIPVAETNDLFRERDYGDWEGRLKTELSDEMQSTDITNLVRESIPNGESTGAFSRRMREALQYIRKHYAGKKVLLIAHHGTIRLMHAINDNLGYPEVTGKELGNTGRIDIKLNPLMKRIPEVLDCWFESGSMPYAQNHYPFAFPGGKTPTGFPADFIAEGIDQTRGWFYTLTVLASALYNKPAFHHCIVNGTVLAEDGRKMSKRLKNYPDPMDVVEKYGADALRFTLMKSPAVRAEDLRFSEKTVEETVRSTLLPLWNCYSFFVTYANAAKFTPQETRTHSSHPLDHYVRAEVQDLVNRMTKQLEAYDLSSACKEVEETIDALTNWYIRLSRRRFAGKGSIDAAEALEEFNETSQHEALVTLHDVLITLSQLLAPFCPFVADAIYLNLLPQDHGSVHLTDWPQERKLTKEEQTLLERNRLLRKLVSLGLKVRSEKKIKVRQPLNSATIAVPSALLQGSKLSEEDLQLLRQELNVKEIAFAHDPGELGSKIVQVNARKVGPRLGGRVQEIIAAGKRGDFTVQEDGSILILDERLAPDEAVVIYQGTEGHDIAADGGIVVSLDTTVTDALKLEGTARDLIRAIQKLRKEQGFSVTDTVTIGIQGADDVLKQFSPLITQETKILLGKPEGKKFEVDLEETKITLFLNS